MNAAARKITDRKQESRLAIVSFNGLLSGDMRNRA